MCASIAAAAGRIEAIAVAGDDVETRRISAMLATPASATSAAPGEMQSPPLVWRHGGGAFLDLMVASPMSELIKLFSASLAQTSDAPIGLEISRAEGAWLIAADGRRYLDFIAGIGVSALGHGHPRRDRGDCRAGHSPSARDGVRRIRDRSQVRLARRLTELLPRKSVARLFHQQRRRSDRGLRSRPRANIPARQGFVAFDGAYHGDTMGALALAGNPDFRAPFEPLPGPVRHLPYDDVARSTRSIRRSPPS